MAGTDLQTLELLQTVEEFLAKRASFAKMRQAADDFEVDYFEIVSGRPAGELYHRDVYIAFSEEGGKDCLSHILDDWEEWELENWLYGPHIYERKGNPAHTKVWNGHFEVPAPLWVLGK